MSARGDRKLKQATHLEQRGDIDGAVTAYREAIRSSGSFEAVSGLGGLLAEQGRTAEAIPLLERALKLRRDLAVLNNLAHAYREERRLEDAARSFEQVILMAPDMPIGPYGLGTVARVAGDLDSAQRFFERAVELSPEMALARLAVAEVEELRGRPDRAIQTLTRILADFGARVPGVHRRLGALHAFHGNRAVGEAMLKMAVIDDPEDPIAAHMLLALQGDNAEPPDAYVTALFDAFADGYDAHLVEALETRVPALIAKAAGEAGTVLDLGCGTGLAVRAMSGVTQAVGVDLSPKMVQRARHSGLYENVTCGELTDFLRSQDDTWETVVAADVLAYLGSLEELFAATLPRTGRQFVFTTENSEQGWALRRTGRYAHAPDYVREAAEGWTVERSDPVELRRERDGWVSGTLWVLRPLP